MSNLFSNVKDYQDGVKADSKSSVLAKLKTEMAITKLELKAYKNQIKQAASELAKITVNLEKTKLEFEQLLTQQMIKKKNILQLEKEHKFILTELALFAKHNNVQLLEKLYISKISILNEHLFDHIGFQGDKDDYYNPKK